MYNNHIIGAITASEGFEYTGSFARIQCTSGSKHVGDTINEVIFETISFGPYVEPQSHFTASNQIINYTHSLSQDLANSTVLASQDPNIQGPITRFKVAKGKVLAYFTKQGISSTEA